MYLDQNFMPSNQRRAMYALRTPPVRDEALGAWHVRLEFPDTPGVLAFETYTTDLDLSQVRFVRFRKHYYENGQLLRETYFNAQGEELLGGCVYFENGQVQQRVTALPNGRDSISETYHENGQLMSRTLVSRRRDGRWRARVVWRERGRQQPLVSTQWQDGWRAGIVLCGWQGAPTGTVRRWQARG